MIDGLAGMLETAQSALFERLTLPVLFDLGLMRFAEDAYAATGWLLLGLAQIAVLWLVLRPLEAWRPVEAWADRRAIRVDVLYTFLERLGVIPLFFFVTLRPAVESLDAALRLFGYIPPQLEDVVPALAGRPLLAFLAYLIVLDLSEYVRHRLQHRLSWWWALHSVHHSQRQLSLWADDRNHVVDTLLSDLWRALGALIIGVPGGQFAAVVFATRVIESLSHANTRLGLGVLERLVVGPRFHRLHHAIGAGHEGPARGTNFAALLPVWDVIFGTADFRRIALPTGIRDQLDGVVYGDGFWSQQVKGLERAGRVLAAEARRLATRAPGGSTP